jgi:cytochrome P450
MCKSSSTTVPMMRWSSIVEHIIKAALYTYFCNWSVIRAIMNSHHTIAISYSSATTVFYSLVGIYTLWMIKNELDLIVKRIQRKLPPGYLGFPIIREIQFIRSISSSSGVMKSLHEKRSRYGTLFAQYFIGGGTNIVAGGQEDLNWLFNNDRKALTEVAWPPNIVMLLGPGAVANQTGKYHRVLRRLLEPYFAPKFVSNYLNCMHETTSDELESWCKTGEFVSSEVFKMYALRLFYVSAFGNVDEEMIASLHDDFKIWLGGFLSLTTKQIPGTSFTEAMKARDRILNTVDTLIDKFMLENPENSERAQITIIGRLIYGKDKDNNRVMTRDEMKDNILNLIFAGHDTTYASISTLLYHLSENNDAMDALTDEVTKLSDSLTADELRNAPVLNACMHESWRVDPPVPGSFRKAVKELHHKGYSFDAGTVFNYSILMAVTDENLYKSHEKFDMRRFLPEDHPLYCQDIDSGIDPFQGRSSYPIFGGGTHVCLGKAFAQLELRVLTARLLREYKVEARNPKKVAFPVNGWNIEFKLTRRKDL